MVLLDRGVRVVYEEDERVGSSKLVVFFKYQGDDGTKKGAVVGSVRCVKGTAKWPFCIITFQNYVRFSHISKKFKVF